MKSALTASTVSDRDAATTDFSYDIYSGYNDSLVPLREDEPFGGTFSGVLYILIFLLSLVANVLLLWDLLAQAHLRKTTTLYLVQLAAADLLLTLTLPFWAVYQLHHWVFGDFGCRLLVFLFFLGFCGYMAFLAAVTVNSYLAVVHGWRMLRVGPGPCVALSSVPLWLVCVAASASEALYSETAEGEGGTRCQVAGRPLHLELLGYGVQLVLFFLLPLVLIVFCYTRIWATAFGRRLARRRRRTEQLILGMVVGFFACWAPYNVVLVLGALRLLGCPALTGPEAEEGLGYAYYICHALAYCHCFINPALHVFGSGRFRICRRWQPGEETDSRLTSGHERLRLQSSTL